jgi:hypothetical protein
LLLEENVQKICRASGIAFERLGGLPVHLREGTGS